MNDILIPSNTRYNKGRLSIREKDKDYEVIYYIFNIEAEDFEMEDIMIIDKNLVKNEINNIVG